MNVSIVSPPVANSNTSISIYIPLFIVAEKNLNSWSQAECTSFVNDSPRTSLIASKRLEKITCNVIKNGKEIRELQDSIYFWIMWQWYALYAYLGHMASGSLCRNLFANLTVSKWFLQEIAFDCWPISGMYWVQMTNSVDGPAINQSSANNFISP